MSNPPVDAAAKTDKKQPCRLPYGIQPTDSEKQVRQRLLAQGAVLKQHGEFNPPSFFGLTFKKGSYRIGVRGPRKGKLTEISLNEQAFRKPSACKWVYNRFTRESQQRWREKPLVGRPPDTSGSHDYVARHLEWRCGPARRWVMELVWVSQHADLDCSVTARWYHHRPRRISEKDRKAGLAGCKPIGGLTAAELRTTAAAPRAPDQADAQSASTVRSISGRKSTR